jgi:hypothetical protein
LPPFSLLRHAAIADAATPLAAAAASPPTLPLSAADAMPFIFDFAIVFAASLRLRFYFHMLSFIIAAAAYV